MILSKVKAAGSRTSRDGSLFYPMLRVAYLPPLRREVGEPKALDQ